ncbi:hypothetical protein N9M10_03830 [Hellea sp.]|nr:hypothetical protein [Hellea sp.]
MRKEQRDNENPAYMDNWDSYSDSFAVAYCRASHIIHIKHAEFV